MNWTEAAASYASVPHSGMLVPQEKSTRRPILAVMCTVGVLLLLGACSTYFDPSDRYILGLRWYDRGRPELALEQWEPLAQQGDCDAQYRLGSLYFLGEGVPQDLASALGLLRTAADQGQALAELVLATMYAQNRIVLGSFQRGVPFDCRRGCGVDLDMEQAYGWMLLAMKNTPYPVPDEQKQKFLDAYRKRMTAEQIQRAEATAVAWTPRPALCKQRRIR